MYSGDLKEDLDSIRTDLETLTTEFTDQMQDLAVREEKWLKMDKEASEISVNQNQIICLNIGGEKFATKAETLLKVKDTLLYKILISKKFDNKKEIFFDRFSTYFQFILDYLRYNRLTLKRFKKHELEELLIEVEYFEVNNFIIFSLQTLQVILLLLLKSLLPLNLR